ncbi:tRNA adenosine(34) deaminase TadA [Halioxenophilus sp. WMMB6]|uniref:tRNA adenosine(34) deaminase TadA n=1 Tax=Halioxenophilus sp. WMMB6 TaxID=3073815 RepID=UPI00295E2FD2|nr:tRNA adenosine(34) deaminase TadA [Halioxenophilus sp. WMMB6]
MTESDEFFMQQALQLAQQAADAGEVPVGAVVVCDGQVVGEGWNQPITGCDPTAHAEIVALRQAATALGNYRLVDCDLFVTLEPCTMCAGAIIHSRVKRLIYGAREPKAGVVDSNLQLLQAQHSNHRLQVVSGLLADQSAALLTDFFQSRRAAKRELKNSLKEG